jgi:hypothetical protein
MTIIIIAGMPFDDDNTKCCVAAYSTMGKVK